MDPAVGLVKAYLELCGYFVLSELPIRKAEGAGHYQDVTDVDIVGVRFPHQAATDLPDPFALLLGSDPGLATFEAGADVIIGEVKEGKASINPALRREGVIAFTLRRLGCCPPEEILERAKMVAQMGVADMEMAPSLPCRVRLVAFAGRGTEGGHGVQTISLAHCASVVEQRMREANEALAGARWKEPTLALFALLAKITTPRGQEAALVHRTRVP